MNFDCKSAQRFPGYSFIYIAPSTSQTKLILLNGLVDFTNIYEILVPFSSFVHGNIKYMGTNAADDDVNEMRILMGSNTARERKIEPKSIRLRYRRNVGST